MKTMCPPGYHHNGFVATHALGHMMYIIFMIAYNVYTYMFYIYQCKMDHDNLLKNAMS